MTPEQAASVVREVETVLNAANDRLLDTLVSRLLTPAELKWNDARVHAPPQGVMVLVVRDGHVEFAAYLGEDGQPYRRLPNEGAYGHWSYGDGWEGTQQIRWWMPIPLAPKED